MNKIELKLFSSFHVEKLFRNVASTNNDETYLQDSFRYEEIFSKGGSGIFINPKFTLDPKRSDIENSIMLYEELKGLNEVQASDERLWATLAHTQFWNYMRERWPVEKAKNHINRIRTRYFLRSLNLESLSRHGISRLWWYAHITLDENRKNKHELLEVMLQRQDLAVGITERALGTNHRIRTGVLEFLYEHPEIASTEDKTRELFKGINLCGGVKILPMLEVSEIKELLRRVSGLHAVGI